MRPTFDREAGVIVGALIRLIADGNSVGTSTMVSGKRKTRGPSNLNQLDGAAGCVSSPVNGRRKVVMIENAGKNNFTTASLGNLH